MNTIQIWSLLKPMLPSDKTIGGPAMSHHHNSWLPTGCPIEHDRRCSHYPPIGHHKWRANYPAIRQSIWWLTDCLIEHNRKCTNHPPIGHANDVPTTLPIGMTFDSHRLSHWTWLIFYQPPSLFCFNSVFYFNFSVRICLWKSYLFLASHCCFHNTWCK